MEEEDCGCQFNKTETKEYIFSNPDTVGEEIFDEDDIFEKVKNYYKNNNNEEEGQYLDEDLLLEDLNSSENLNKELMFINELRTNKINKEENKEEIKEENKEENKEEIKEENKEEEEKNYNPYKEKKINYIKDYLKKLKDGF